MSSNYATRAILALPGLTEGQLRFLIALETITAGDDGWRRTSTGTLAEHGHISPSTVARARDRIAARKFIEYDAGGRKRDERSHEGQHLGRYRFAAELNGGPPLPGEKGSRMSDDPKGGRMGDYPSHGQRVVTEGVKGSSNGPSKGRHPDSVTCDDAAGAFKTSVLKDQVPADAPPQARPRKTAKGLRGTRPIDVIKIEIQDRLGEAVTDEWAAKIEALLRERGVAHAGGFRAAIQREPNPRLAFLAQDGRHRPRRLVALPAALAGASSRSDEGADDGDFPF